MADALSLEITAALQWVFNEERELSVPSDKLTLEWKKTWTDGSGVGLVSAIWHSKRRVAGGATDTLNLQALPLTLFGNSETMNFASVKLLAMLNCNMVAGEDLYIDTGAPANPWYAPFNATTELEIAAYSPLLLANHRESWTVASGSKNLAIINDSSYEITYKIVVAGALA